MRLFLAINFAAEVRRSLFEATAPLREAAPALSWVRASHLHLTLKFFGEQSPEMAAQLATAIGQIAVRHREVEVELAEVGAFPNFRRPRVVWMGVSPEPKLELLHHDVESVCADLGFPLDGRPFRPHLTLARVKPRSADGSALRALERAAEEVAHREETVVSSIDLMQSELSTTGSRYTMLSSALLGPT